MESLTALLQDHGPAALFLVGFLEYVGAPIAAVPVLIMAGALSAGGPVPFQGIVLAAALGGLAGDSLWYMLARVRGRGLVDTVCGLATNPMACVLGVEKRIRAVGPRYLLLSKFIPGVGNLAAAASGFAGVAARRFVLLDAAALALWATVYAGLGRIFSPQVEVVIEWVLGLGRFALVLAGILVLAAGAWRFLKVRMHRPHHEAARAAAAAAADGTQEARTPESARNSARDISSTNAS